VARPPVHKAEGTTPSEQHLARLCRQSFLSLWSFPNVFHNEGMAAGAGAGKELCDLLVVFDNDVIISSDKTCRVTASGNTHTDWRRWYERAIVGNLNQIKGAERHIKLFPDTLYLDRACTQRFPLPIPDPAVARYHRVIVAHGASERIRQEIGGSGALRIKPDILGSQHTARFENGGEPFTIGQVDPAFGYVHVLDDASLDVVMCELDTISDFVAYLTRKESIVLDGTLEYAPSELDLVADYLFPIDGKFNSDFTKPAEGERLSIHEGRWAAFDEDGYRQKRKQEDVVSYLWDRIIEESSTHALAGTLLYPVSAAVAEVANGLRWMARENRFARRYLSTWVADAVEGSRRTSGNRITRSTSSKHHGTTVFTVLLLASNIKGATKENYPGGRRILLSQVVEVAKLKHPDATDVIGIATDMYPNQFRSQDIAYRDFREYTEVERKRAWRIARDTGLLRKVRRGETTHAEHPHPNSAPLRVPFHAEVKTAEPRNPNEALRPDMKGAERNKRCPCGSGKKHKHCCGKPGQQVDQALVSRSEGD
jgi:hypothetical protein